MDRREIASEVEIDALDQIEARKLSIHISRAYVEGQQAHFEPHTTEDDCPHMRYSQMWVFWVAGFHLENMPVYPG